MMMNIQQKLTRFTERLKTQFEETKQASEKDSDMVGMLELSGLGIF